MQESPKYACDLILKGGITSGIVYPPAIAEIAKDHKLCSVGGASAGAIGAVAAAAAELGRSSETGGFKLLETLPAALAETDSTGRTKLQRLFQAEPATSQLFDLVWFLRKYRGRELMSGLISPARLGQEGAAVRHAGRGRAARRLGRPAGGGTAARWAVVARRVRPPRRPRGSRVVGHEQGRSRVRGVPPPGHERPCPPGGQLPRPVLREDATGVGGRRAHRLAACHDSGPCRSWRRPVGRRGPRLKTDVGRRQHVAGRPPRRPGHLRRAPRGRHRPGHRHDQHQPGVERDLPASERRLGLPPRRDAAAVPRRRRGASGQALPRHQRRRSGRLPWSASGC